MSELDDLVWRWNYLITDQTLDPKIRRTLRVCLKDVANVLGMPIDVADPHDLRTPAQHLSGEHDE